MKMEMVFVGRLLMKGSKNGIKDPKKVYYSLSIGSNGECDTFNCPDEVYNKVVEGKEYPFVCTFNTQYPTAGIRVTGIAADGK